MQKYSVEKELSVLNQSCFEIKFGIDLSHTAPIKEHFYFKIIGRMVLGEQLNTSRNFQSVNLRTAYLGI